MLYGITGNTDKQLLWAPVHRLITRMNQRGMDFRLSTAVAQGLWDRGLLTEQQVESYAIDALWETDMVLSFGGDGTLINTARLLAPHETPILGVNIGRLGFLTFVEVNELESVLEKLEHGHYTLMSRLVLEARLPHDEKPRWALNEFVFTRGGVSNLITVETRINGSFLCDYWADGLILATPTGSTAYSLSAGGPILTPGCGSYVITPIAPHTLTMRPIIIPKTSEIEVLINPEDCPFLLVADGISETIHHLDAPVLVREAAHGVKLVLPQGHDYFSTLRRKLGWGYLNHANSNEDEEAK